MLNVFKKELTINQAVEFILLFDFELTKKMQGPFDSFINLYDKEISEQIKIKCGYELGYLITSCIYLILMVNRDLKGNKNEVSSHYLEDVYKILHNKCSKELGDYAVSQLDLRIQAYRLAWISKELNSLTGIRSILQSTVSAIIKTDDFSVADDIVLEYIHNQNSINNESFQFAHEIPGLIAGTICMDIINATHNFFSQFSKDFKII
jgi:hypothetical protein